MSSSVLPFSSSTSCAPPPPLPPPNPWCSAAYPPLISPRVGGADFQGGAKVAATHMSGQMWPVTSNWKKKPVTAIIASRPLLISFVFITFSCSGVMPLVKLNGSNP
jgi:hypothetical protein